MLYDLVSKDFDFNTETTFENGLYSIIKLSQETLVPSNDPVNDTNVGYLYLPKNIKSHKPVIVVHGMGSRNLPHLSYYTRKFASRGIPSIMPILPYHYDRAGKGDAFGRPFLLDDMDDSIRDFRQAVVDIRALLEVLVRMGVSDGNFSLITFSFGGMIGVILMGVEDKIKEGVFVATGGNYRYITWESLATRTLRKKYEIQSNNLVYGCNKEKCIQLHKDYAMFLGKISSALDIESLNFPKGCYLFDPLTFAPLLKGRKVLIYRALFDEIIPKEATEELWKYAGKPRMKTLFSDHYLTILYRKMIFEDATKLFGGDL
ncbi:MAG: hypothetical protein ACP5SB_03070 [Caldisericaceae bacterium]